MEITENDERVLLSTHLIFGFISLFIFLIIFGIEKDQYQLFERDIFSGLIIGLIFSVCMIFVGTFANYHKKEIYLISLFAIHILFVIIIMIRGGRNGELFLPVSIFLIFHIVMGMFWLLMRSKRKSEGLSGDDNT